ncbi:Crp/Fnr family transcriptional regulator [Sphingomonas sp. 3P27F8]|uniref:Crp/Fnr family transcriptional regulator n=1 Tax=Sphingomonas sp. 3P27F8 TaxID=2502213 RepID=UPI0010F54F9D|nr:Crp/Fnr family transcriptional regulator [Sphingomonas sp. 3P27F8]
MTNGEDCATIRASFRCDAPVAESILLKSRKARHRRRAVLYSSSADEKDALVLLQGSAHEMAYGRSGQSLKIDQFSKGDLFGDFIDGNQDTATEVIGQTETRTAALSPASLNGFMECHPCVAHAVLHHTFRQYSKLKSLVVDGLLLSGTGRICAEILRLCDASEDGVIRPSPVVSRLALQLNLSRGTASRTLSNLEKKGIIEWTAEGLKVVSRHRLEEMII